MQALSAFPGGSQDGWQKKLCQIQKKFSQLSAIFTYVTTGSRPSGSAFGGICFEPEKKRELGLAQFPQILPECLAACRNFINAY
jgi:hypothetical protein